MDEVVNETSDTSSADVDINAIASEAYAELSADPQPASETSPTEQPPADAAPISPQAVSEETSAPETAEPPAAGAIPLDRHKAILETERTHRARVETQLETVKAQIISPMQTDPVGWLVESFAEVLHDPRYQSDPRLKSFAGRQLGTRVAQTTAAPDVPMPEITPLVDSAGNKVYAVEDVQALLQWTREAVLSQVKQELKPLEDIKTERAAEQKMAEARAVVSKVTQKSASIMERYRKAPGWTKELEPRVKAAYQKHLAEGSGPESAIAFAYQDVIVPTLSQQERKAVVSALQQKTHASAIAPTRVTAPAKVGPMETSEITRQVLAEMSGAS